MPFRTIPKAVSVTAAGCTNFENAGYKIIVQEVMYKILMEKRNDFSPHSSLSRRSRHSKPCIGVLFCDTANGEGIEQAMV
jgi:hypothetical protein